ncbi:MAG TPA: hypothetical protein VKC90_07615 [Chitinophagaceae bacterium]|nr:hypothetical protein [Chitinophagaceae bacterium]
MQLQTLRTIVRKNSKTIINYIANYYIKRYDGKAYVGHIPRICMFCSSTINITREHVLPRWVFEKSTEKKFITNINELSQTYNKTTIPSCSACNSILLNDLEKHINQLLSNHNLPNTFFTSQEIENIVRWLEIIDYKFQIINATRKFLTSKKGGFIPYLTDFPISVLDPNFDYSPSRVITELRRSLKRITIKSKTQYINSLVVFKTSNSGLNFFHKMNNYVFLELPQKKVALFYFYQRTFERVENARDEALAIIRKNY